MSEEPWRRDVIEALRHGQKIEAIKLYRTATGTGLAEAKDFVEALEQTLKTGELPPAQVELAADLEQRLVEHLRGGNVIAAIKHHREATGSSLYDSKQVMEVLARQKGITVSSPLPIAVWMLAVALVFGGVIAWMFLR